MSPAVLKVARLFIFMQGVAILDAQDLAKTPLPKYLKSIANSVATDPIELRLARASVRAAALTSQSWDAVAVHFPERESFFSPQAPDLDAVVARNFSSNGKLRFDYWLIAYRSDQTVGLTKAAFRALNIYQLYHDLRHTGDQLSKRVLALPTVEKTAMELPIVKAIEFECRPFTGIKNECGIFRLCAIVTLCAGKKAETVESFSFGADVLVQRFDGKQWKAQLVKSKEPNFYVREQNGAEVFYELGGYRSN